MHPTEDKAKITIALHNIIDGEIIEEKIGDDSYLMIESTNPSALEKIHTMVRQQRILDVARNTLRNNIVGNSTIFYINKQVAFVNKFNLCEEEGESPLGPIRIEIEYDIIDHLIDWLTPYTKNGREIVLVKSFP